MLQGRPTPFEGALEEPKERRFDFIANTERSLQPTASAISAVGRLLRAMSRICVCCDSARFGAILGSEWTLSKPLWKGQVAWSWGLRPTCSTELQCSLRDTVALYNKGFRVWDLLWDCVIGFLLGRGRVVSFLSTRWSDGAGVVRTNQSDITRGFYVL